MSGPNQHIIRRALLRHPDGLTLRELNKVTGIAIESCVNSLKRCYGCYVSHWREVSPDRKMLCQVWKCIPVPEGAKRPVIKITEEEKKQRQEKYQMDFRNKHLDIQIRAEAEKYKKKMKAQREKKKEPKKPAFTSTGLTTIRGPWPTWDEVGGRL